MITCDICGEEREALIHTDTVLHPEDERDGLFLHPFVEPDEGPDPDDLRDQAWDDEYYGFWDDLRDQAWDDEYYGFWDGPWP